MTRTMRTAIKPGTSTKYPKEIVQEALQTTFVLKGTLKRVQLMYLRVGELLVKVRDQKLYEALKHPDMASYARERLGLGQTSLYNYLRIHDWVSRSHPEWLKPKPSGFIPDLSDVGDLMWIESELAKPNISSARRALLEELRKKGLEGQLRQSDVRKLRRHDNTPDAALKELLSQLRRLRKRASQLASVSPEIVVQLDVVIRMMANDNAMKTANIAPPDRKWRQNISA